MSRFLQKIFLSRLFEIDRSAPSGGGLGHRPSRRHVFRENAELIRQVGHGNRRFVGRLRGRRDRCILYRCGIHIWRRFSDHRLLRWRRRGSTRYSVAGQRRRIGKARLKRGMGSVDCRQIRPSFFRLNGGLFIGDNGRVVGYDGHIVHDRSKPDGTPRKLMDVGLMKAAGWQARTQLEDGLRVAYAEFAAQHTAV